MFNYFAPQSCTLPHETSITPATTTERSSGYEEQRPVEYSSAGFAFSACKPRFARHTIKPANRSRTGNENERVSPDNHMGSRVCVRESCLSVSLGSNLDRSTTNSDANDRRRRRNDFVLRWFITWVISSREEITIRAFSAIHDNWTRLNWHVC